MRKHKRIKDSERFSIIQDNMDICYFCRRPLAKGEGAIHECLSGTANRQKSKDYGLVVRLCFNHHDPQSPFSVHANPKGSLNKRLHHDARVAFEKNYPDESFLEVFGRNYDD